MSELQLRQGQQVPPQHCCQEAAAQQPVVTSSREAMQHLLRERGRVRGFIHGCRLLTPAQRRQAAALRWLHIPCGEAELALSHLSVRAEMPLGCNISLAGP